MNNDNKTTHLEESNKETDNNHQSSTQITFLNKKHNKESTVPMTKEQIAKYEKNKRKTNKQKEKKKQKWYDAKISSNVYISNLPHDITKQDLILHFSKYGFIRKDIQTEELKIKIYIDKDTQKPKGDALISYLRPESVDLAINRLNGAEIRPGKIITVEKASFEQKGDYKPRKALVIDDLARYKNKTDIERMLGWNEEEQEKGLLIVILKNMFTPIEFQTDTELKTDIECDITEECTEKCGKILKWQLFEEHPDGIVKLKFRTPAAAEKCIQLFKGRFYNGKQIDAFYWDGKTDYNKYKESEEDEQKRIEEFGKWIEK